jgi:hypothetical protein
MSGAEGELFNLNGSERVGANPRRLHRVAIRFGKLEAFQLALKAITASLTSNARSFGEPIYSLRPAQLCVRLAAVRPLTVLYGVHDHDPEVYIARFRLLFINDQ